MILERPIVFFDLESTGVNPSKDRIVQVGAEILRPDFSRKSYCQLVNPTIPIPAEATAIHGITDEMVKDAPTFSMLSPKLMKAFAGKDLGGYNLYRLDLPMLDEEFRRCGDRLDCSGIRIIDVQAIYFKREQRSLADAVRKYCGREHEGAHGAGDDAKATLEVLFGQFRAYPDLAEMGLSELSEYARLNEHPMLDLAGKLYRDKEGDACFNFGKHKGDKLKFHPDFIEWMLKRDFPGSTLEAVRDEISRLHMIVEGRVERERSSMQEEIPFPGEI